MRCDAAEGGGEDGGGEGTLVVSRQALVTGAPGGEGEGGTCVGAPRARARHGP